MENKSEINKLVEHCFRHESGKMISVLTGIFGSGNLIQVEDIVQDTLVEALNNWTYKGIPQKPVAWLYTVAKNKALNAIKREKHQAKYLLENSNLSRNKNIVALQSEDWFTEESISDDQLRMMFMCCHPALTIDSQIVLILKTLCGFSIGEVARSFLSNNDTINKRLVRAREKIRIDKVPFEVPGEHELDDRVDAVLEAIYLLFNEGYSASVGQELIRIELCTEANRLAEVVLNHDSIKEKANTYALIALMQLNSSRFPARLDENGDIITLNHQNRSLWDLHLMEKGFSNLERSAQTEHISKYHILAGISSYHCSAKDFDSTDWGSILTLYDKLLSVDNSPLVIFNRAIVLSKVSSTKAAISEMKKIMNDKVIQSNYLFYSTLTEFYIQIKELDLAKKSLKKAIELAPLTKEKQMLENRFVNYFNKKYSDNVPIS